ncbi:sensor histidine kinase [Brevibacterium litoralis]|uniref:sensor histidine kinase n=1 Tax=Brevibacterium litoralis TaxID=3138935 RepID=UPI0032EF1F78
MNAFLVLELRVWFLLVLLVVLAGIGVGVWFLARRWLAEREATTRELARQEAERASLGKRNRMLIRLDHELKNPLTALRTSAATVRELIRDESPDPEEIAPVVRQIDISSRRVARLLADLRRLADVESRDIEFSRVDMDRLIHQAVEDARTAPGAEDRMIVATVARAPWRLPDVAGEEDLLLSAILNLLGNAIKYSSDTDVVELRANEQVINDHRWVVVEVADTGQGIPADEKDGVWDELSRGKRVRQVAGSGMGLSLVRSIITRHGGSVELYSQEGVGTSVRIILPVLADTHRGALPGGRGPAGALPGPGGPAVAAAGMAAGRAVGDIAQSRPVQPVQDTRGVRPGGQGPVGSGPRPVEGGAYVPGGGFVPPLGHADGDPSKILGTPRRTSRRRLQTIDGAIVDTATGEAFGGGPGSGPQGSGPAPGAEPADEAPAEGATGGPPVGSGPVPPVPEAPPRPGNGPGSEPAPGEGRP